MIIACTTQLGSVPRPPRCSKSGTAKTVPDEATSVYRVRRPCRIVVSGVLTLRIVVPSVLTLRIVVPGVLTKDRRSRRFNTKDRRYRCSNTMDKVSRGNSEYRIIRNGSGIDLGFYKSTDRLDIPFHHKVAAGVGFIIHTSFAAGRSPSRRRAKNVDPTSHSCRVFTQ